MRPLPERPLNFSRRLRFLLFPARCPACGEVLLPQKLLCASCEKKLFADFSLRRFELHLKERSVLLTAAAVWDYAKTEQMIKKYKFDGKIDARDALGAAMAMLAEDKLGVDFDLVTSVPSRPKRAKDLGFDHAGELAKCTARGLNLPYRPLLYRKEDVRVQHTLSREERLVNLRGAFTPLEDLTGKRILLVDDVVTTGSTLCECTKTLYKAGAARVEAVCASSAGK